MSETRADEQEQDEVVACLRDPGAYPHAVDEVVHVQTHISHVFLAGAYVYKLKKAVVFPFLDFGTVVARERSCREELRLNRRLAAPIYLDVLPVTRAGGRIRLGGDGAALDWVVRMRRLPAERTLGALVGAGAASDETIGRLAAHLARFHAAAPAVPGGDPDALVAGWTENLDGVRAAVGRLLAAEDFEILDDFGRTFVVRHDSVLRARPALGRVREGHGDLRLDHVYVLDRALPALEDAPEVPAGLWVVDCIEFSAAFRSVDVAADLAFLAMELEQVGRADLAHRLVTAYAEAASDPLVPALVPYHASHRAIVRGKVDALAADETEVPPAERAAAATRAREELALAGRFAWRSGEPVVIACAGLSGSGKSAIAALLGTATGWRVLASDLLRKTMPDPPGGRYGPAPRAAVYARIRREVERALAARESVIVDATFIARAERDRLARSVRGYGARHLFVEGRADEAVIRRRLDTRDASAVSDARVDVYLEQRRARDAFVADEPVLAIDTSGAVETARRGLLRAVWAWRQGRPLVRS